MSYLKRDRGVVWVTPPTRRMGDEEIEQLLGELEGQLRSGAPYVLLFDLSRASLPSATQRQKLAGHIRKNESSIRRWVRGLGVILTSPLARGVVTAIFWVSPPPVAHRFFATRAEATPWAQSLVEARPTA
jgi:hypothetical protein